MGFGPLVKWDDGLEAFVGPQAFTFDSTQMLASGIHMT